MARLEAIAKGLFYPTPGRVVDMIADQVKVTAPDGGRLLDICSGEGVADLLADRWGLESYGVELHTERATRSAMKMTAALCGSYHQLDAPEKAFSVLFLNPPYDDGCTEEGYSARQEIVFLRDAIEADWLAEDGLLVYVVPQTIVDRWDVRSLLGRYFRAVEAYRFPDPEFDAFKQVVVFGRRRGTESYTGGVYLSGDYPVLGEPRDQSTRDQSTLDGGLPEGLVKSFHFKLKGENPFALAPDTNEGCYRTPLWRTLVGSNDPCAFERPLMAPRPGHIAMLLAAGSLNGTELPGGRIIKGSSEKITYEVKNEEEDSLTIRERIVSRLSTLTLETGEIVSWRTDQEPEQTKEWFTNYGVTLANAVRRDHTPLYDGSFVESTFDAVRAPGTLFGLDKPTILDAQKRAASAISLRWKTHKSVVVSGEMGVGKTTIGVLATHLYGFEKIIVVCPTHLVKKWLRETDVITKTKGIARTANKVSEVEAFFADPAARYLVLSKERAKLGAKWAPAVSYRRVMIEREIQEESRYSSYSRSAPSFRIVKSIERVACCVSCGAVVRDGDGNPASIEWLARSKRACKADGCGEQLWTAQALSAKGTTRWPLASYINKRFSGRFALVVDEAHQYVHASSDQSRAIQLLCTSSTHILAMTGTLYGGRASSIFHLLYKVDPKFRDVYGYTDTPKFVDDHGLLESVHKLSEYSSTYGYRRNNSGGRVREVPGVNPAMLNLLLSYTVFIKLADLGYKLPPFSEEVRLIDHDPEVHAAATALASNVKALLRENPKVLGAYLMSCLGYPDCPEHAESIKSVPDNKWETPVELASAPAFESKLWPKDKMLVEIALEEKIKGLRVLVLFTQTGKRSPIERVQKHLENVGLRVLVLDGDVAPDEREDWLRDKVDSFDVLLTNGRLVETGLDLLFATTIVQYAAEYSIPTLRQSTRRSWRLGQTRAVRVIYLAYRNTMQSVALMLIARKMRAAELVDGDDLGGLSQHDESGHDFMLELARAAASESSTDEREIYFSNPKQENGFVVEPESLDGGFVLELDPIAEF